MTPTHSDASARLNRRQLLALAISSAALTACGGGTSEIKDAANTARRKSLLEQTASKAVATGLVSAFAKRARLLPRPSATGCASGLSPRR
jgi:hypothetical protein